MRRGAKVRQKALSWGFQFCVLIPVGHFWRLQYGLLQCCACSDLRLKFNAASQVPGPQCRTTALKVANKQPVAHEVNFLSNIFHPETIRTFALGAPGGRCSAEAGLLPSIDPEVVVRNRTLRSGAVKAATGEVVAFVLSPSVVYFIHNNYTLWKGTVASGLVY